MAAAGNSRFAVTCGLLRQYMMREHKHQPRMGGLAGSSLLPPLREATEDDAQDTDARTMQLFPTHAGVSEETPSTKQTEEQARAPLTIFYEGRMLVFEDFPADGAEELMQLCHATSGSPVVPKKPAATKPSAGPSDMPIARKESLKRFLQKRKHRGRTVDEKIYVWIDRIVATDPYHKETAREKEAATDKPVKDEPASSWLAL
ncbi:hypothetical protein EJB05_22574 [Eragrostis curvula]|uniref:Protein TIFY n=1 Tax=Eragrostis curvula TaxID=38414 RepID=A0A5J9V6B4_9POAL|nr:hypothetical protein EJB05_22574 [Eragrostis curvula]